MTMKPRAAEPSTPRSVAGAILIAALVTFGAIPLRAQVIDRVLATVGDAVILLSDAMAALRFGLVEVEAPGVDPVASVLPHLIERQLQLAEVNRYAPPEPAPKAIDERLAAIRARFPTPAAFDAALAESGLTADELRSRVRDSLRIDAYRTQRFGAALLPTEDDVARYYRAHAAEFARQGSLPSYEQAREEARRRLVAERTTTLIQEWMDGLRRRTEVTIVYRSGLTPIR
jgi:hypothetical protein